MQNDLADIHYKRAHEEMDRGRRATVIAVADAHFNLARLHLERAHAALTGRAGPEDSLLSWVCETIDTSPPTEILVMAR